MTDVNIIESIEHNEVKNVSKFREALPQFLAVGVKNLLLYGYGMTLGFPTIVIPAIQGGEGRDASTSNEIILNRDEISWFSSINLLCVPLGCIFSGMITEPFGKRVAMQLVNIPIFTAWLFFHFSTNIFHLYAGLCLSGLSGGLMEASVLTYVAEVTQPRVRGMLAATGSAFIILGIFTQFLMATYIKWRTIAAISVIFPILSVITIFFIPESPHWLIRKKRYDEAKKSLAFLRGWVPITAILAEYNDIYQLLSRKKAESVESKATDNSSNFTRKLKLYTKKNFLLPYALISLAFFIGHFSGKTTLQTYAVQIFHTLKAPIDKYYATTLLGVSELLGTIICVVLVHFTGKRRLVLTSVLGCGLCFFGTATYAKFLHSVPGVAVDNIVANNSQLDLNREHIITEHNVTDIIIKQYVNNNLDQENYTLLVKALETVNNDIENSPLIDLTTIMPDNEPIIESKNDDSLMNNEKYLYEIENENSNTEISTTEISTEIENDNGTEPNNLNDGDGGGFREKREISNLTIADSDYFNEFNLTDDQFDFYNLNDADADLSVNYTDYDLLNDNDPDHSVITLDDNVTILSVKPLSSVKPVKIDSIVDEIVLQIPEIEENKFIWLPLTLLIVAALFSHVGIKLIPWMLIGEIFPSEVRSGGSGISSGTGYIFGFLANKLFLNMLSTMTLPGTFWFYSSVSFIGAIILYFWLPETEGQTLVAIEEHFSGGKKLKKMNRKSKRDRKRPIAVDHISGGNTATANSQFDVKNWSSNRKFEEHLKLKNEIALKEGNPRNYQINGNGKLSTTKDIRNNDVIKFSTHL